MPRRQRDRDLRRVQSTIGYSHHVLSPDEYRRLGMVDVHGDLYAHMLVEDVALLVMPPSLRHDDRAKVLLEPEDRDAEILVAEAIGRDHYGYNLPAAVFDFFHDCVMTMMVYQSAPFELGYFYPPDVEAAVGFVLFPIDPPTLLLEAGKLVQYIPECYVATGEYPPRKKVAVDRLIVFEPPAGCREALAEAVPSLVAISRSRGMDLAVQSFEVGQNELPYDFQMHKYSEHVAVAEATREIGWNGRGLFGEQQTEYYQIHQRLVFARFVIRLRDSILDTLNRALDAASREVRPLGRIQLEGLPTLADVEVAMRHLESGDRSFTETLAPFLSH